MPVLQYFASGDDYTHSFTTRVQLTELANFYPVVYFANLEMTDTMEEAVKEQNELSSTYGEAKTVIRKVTKNRWQEKHVGSKIADI